MLVFFSKKHFDFTEGVIQWLCPPKFSLASDFAGHIPLCRTKAGAFFGNRSFCGRSSKGDNEGWSLNCLTMNDQPPQMLRLSKQRSQ